MIATFHLKLMELYLGKKGFTFIMIIAIFIQNLDNKKNGCELKIGMTTLQLFIFKNVYLTQIKYLKRKILQKLQRILLRLKL